MTSFLIRRLMPFFIFIFFIEFARVSYQAFDSYAHIDWSFLAVVKTLGVLILTTAVSSLFMLIPYVFYLTILPRKKLNSRLDKIVSTIFYTLFVSCNLFEEASSIVFWDEFTAAFNFIAVDYLVYTQEVLSNIYQSYPVVWFLLAIAVSTVLIVVFTSRFLFTNLVSSNFSKRAFHFVIYSLVCWLAFANIDMSNIEINKNRYNNELSKEGTYSLFSAFFKNELPYDDFYITNKTEQNLKILEKQLASHDVQFVSPQKNINRDIDPNGFSKKANVVVVLMESMGSEFLDENRPQEARKITPNLTRLSKEGIFFSKAYATGTRSVRGIEAITLSIPPIPGQSVIRRPGNENLHTVGSIFREKGYETKWIYGGYGYFDNMNYFFGHNGFEVIDRTEWKKGEVNFANAWGAADEDTFRKVIKEADKSYAAEKPFFNILLTISNHRPYTYPDGRIDLPSGKARREGAVKYADYAIGKFLEEAKEKPWFDNTVFVFVADHTAGAAGNEEITISDHHIPAIIYAPKLFKAQRYNMPISQIDLMPTLLSLLNFNYDSRFYGQNVIAKTYSPRFFVSNYQKLGFVKNSIGLILKPVKQYSYKPENAKNIQPVLDEAIAYYQQASDWINNLKDKK